MMKIEEKKKRARRENHYQSKLTHILSIYAIFLYNTDPEDAAEKLVSTISFVIKNVHVL